MPRLNVAMPIAHITAGDYSNFYSSGSCILQLLDKFNENGMDGLFITRNPSFTATPDLFNLFAFTDGYLSFQNNSLFLRLPRDLSAAAVNQYNSKKLFQSLKPFGPQLRSVVYQFNAPPGANVQDKIELLLNDSSHPMRSISKVKDGTTIKSLSNYLSVATNVTAVLANFMAGTQELFVKAGDLIGNCSADEQVIIKFRDSSGAQNPPPANITPVLLNGRPINPSYYLYLVLHNRNSANVTVKTLFLPAPVTPTRTHPLMTLLSAASLPPAMAHLAVDLNSVVPSPPLLQTAAVLDSAGNVMAFKGIELGSLGEWHESRNGSDPINGVAPIQWRNVGPLSSDIVVDNFGKFITKVKTGKNNLLPNGASFDHDHTQAPADQTRVDNYWNRYSSAFNAVALSFEIPCEFLVSIACKETGPWFDTTLGSSDEMDVIAMEKLRKTPAQIGGTNSANVALVTQYEELAGSATVATNKRNANIPIPWNDSAQIGSAWSTLTWLQLATLCNTFTADVVVSPGMMQTTIGTALGDLRWVSEMYGANFISTFLITVGGVTIGADVPPANGLHLFKDWFGVSVDSAGANTSVAANVNQDLTKIKRAFHSIIAGAAHIKRRYNTVEGNNNLITDFDVPTLASGYNDGANSVTAATAGNNTDTKWNKLFALQFYGPGYPSEFPKYYNAAVSLFNLSYQIVDMPTVRLWHF
jgi:hypothetical protein